MESNPENLTPSETEQLVRDSVAYLLGTLPDSKVGELEVLITENKAAEQVFRFVVRIKEARERLEIGHAEDGTTSWEDLLDIGENELSSMPGWELLKKLLDEADANMDEAIETAAEEGAKNLE